MPDSDEPPDREPFTGPFWTDPLHDERQEQRAVEHDPRPDPLTGLFDPGDD